MQISMMIEENETEEIDRQGFGERKTRKNKYSSDRERRVCVHNKLIKTKRSDTIDDSLY